METRVRSKSGCIKMCGRRSCFLSAACLALLGCGGSTGRANEDGGVTDSDGGTDTAALTGGGGCDGVACNSPPKATCSGQGLNTYDPAGVCVNGACVYTPIVMGCAKGCSGDKCIGDPCAGTTCNSPPATACVDPNTLRVYASLGTCDASGTCQYAPSTVVCPQGCEKQACKGQPCAGVICTTPPARTCVDASTLRTYAAAGTCDAAGACQYTVSTQACPAPPAHASSKCEGAVCGFACQSGFSAIGAGCLPSNTWTTVASMQTARYGHAAVAGTDGRIYVFGGWALVNNGGGVSTTQWLNTVEVYSLSTNRWHTAKGMPTARGEIAAVAATDGRIYVMGGGGHGTTVDVYTPSTDSWDGAVAMGEARWRLAGALGANGRIYAIGGLGKATVEVYTPGTDRWTTAASMTGKRGYLAAAVGADGRIYAIGGYGDSRLATVEVYTPNANETNKWAAVASMSTVRVGPAAATGLDGRIYVVGGGNGQINFATMEAYDPRTDMWAPMAPMTTARSSLAAVRGADGRIYAIGGAGGAVLEPQLATVEAYTP